MADLDQVSSQIGELIAMTRSTQSQTKTLFDKFDKINEEVIEQRGALKILGQQFSQHVVDDSKAHRMVEEIKVDFEATKNKGKGMALGLAIVGGGGGLAGFTAAMKAFFGAS